MNQRTRLKRAAAVRHPRQIVAVRKRLVREAYFRYWDTVAYRGLGASRAQLKSDIVRAVIKPIIQQYVGKLLMCAPQELFSARAPKHPDNPHRTTLRPSA